jgi:hypothetical protein
MTLIIMMARCVVEGHADRWWQKWLDRAGSKIIYCRDQKGQAPIIYKLSESDHGRVDAFR